MHTVCVGIDIFKENHKKDNYVITEKWEDGQKEGRTRRGKLR